jgi:hypothetical protein
LRIKRSREEEEKKKTDFRVFALVLAVVSLQEFNELTAAAATAANYKIKPVWSFLSLSLVPIKTAEREREKTHVI